LFYSCGQLWTHMHTHNGQPWLPLNISVVWTGGGRHATSGSITVG
jgi:hypothetical protein